MQNVGKKHRLRSFHVVTDSGISLWIFQDLKHRMLQAASIWRHHIFNSEQCRAETTGWILPVITFIGWKAGKKVQSIQGPGELPRCAASSRIGSPSTLPVMICPSTLLGASRAYKMEKYPSHQPLGSPAHRMDVSYWYEMNAQVRVQKWKFGDYLYRGAKLLKSMVFLKHSDQPPDCINFQVRLALELSEASIAWCYLLVLVLDRSWK